MGNPPDPSGVFGGLNAHVAGLGLTFDLCSPHRARSNSSLQAVGVGLRAQEAQGSTWGFHILMLHFSCNLGIFTGSLQPRNPHRPPLLKPWSSTQTAPGEQIYRLIRLHVRMAEGLRWIWCC